MADLATMFKKALDTSAKAITKAAKVTGKAIGTAAEESGKAISRVASNTVTDTRFKVNEMSIMRKRSEVLAELGAKVYELALAGAVMPEEAAAIIAKVQEVDAELDALRSEHNAQKAEAAQLVANEKAARAAQKAAAKGDKNPVAANDVPEMADDQVCEEPVEEDNKPSDVPTLDIPDEQ